MRLLFELSWINFCWQIWWIFKDRGWLSRRSSLRPGSPLSFAHWHLALAKGSQIPTSLLAKAKSLQNHHMLWKFNDVIGWVISEYSWYCDTYPMLGRRSRLAAVTSSYQLLGWSPATGASRSTSMASYEVQALQIQVPVAFPCGPVEEHSTITLSLCFININHNFFNHQISSEYYPASGCLMFLDVFIAVVNDICAGRSFPWSRHPCLLARTTSIRCRPASEACSLCLMFFLLFFIFDLVFHLKNLWALWIISSFSVEQIDTFTWKAQNVATTWKVSFLEGTRTHGPQRRRISISRSFVLSSMWMANHKKWTSCSKGFCVLNICFGQASVRQQLKDTNLLSFYMLSLSFL